jgi:Tc toxin complex TcA C-terminal TcB-binding domain
MFEANLRDERFLPFDGAGAESTWKPEPPKDWWRFNSEWFTTRFQGLR